MRWEDPGSILEAVVLLAQGFGHLDQVAWQLRRMLIVREREGSVFDVSEPPVVSVEFLAQIHDRQVHEKTAGGTAVFFGHRDQARTHTGSLSRGIDCEQAEISSIAAHFLINAADQDAGFFDEQEFSLLEKLAHFVWVGAVRVAEEALRAEGSVHQARNVFGVGEVGGARSDRVHASF